MSFTKRFLTPKFYELVVLFQMLRKDNGLHYKLRFHSVLIKTMWYMTSCELQLPNGLGGNFAFRSKLIFVIWVTIDVVVRTLILYSSFYLSYGL